MNGLPADMAMSAAPKACRRPNTRAMSKQEGGRVSAIRKKQQSSTGTQAPKQQSNADKGELSWSGWCSGEHQLQRARKIGRYCCSTALPTSPLLS